MSDSNKNVTLIIKKQPFNGCFLLSGSISLVRVCSHFKNGNQNEINFAKPHHSFYDYVHIQNDFSLVKDVLTLIKHIRKPYQP